MHVEVTHTAYSLYPSQGWASEQLIEVRQASSVIAVMGSRSTAEDAKTIAATLSDTPIDQVEVITRYFRREHRNASMTIYHDRNEDVLTSLDALHGHLGRIQVVGSPTAKITRAEYDSLLYPKRA